MNAANIQLEPFSEENKKFFSAFYWLALLGLGVAVYIIFFIDTAYIENSRSINSFIDFVPL